MLLKLTDRELQELLAIGPEQARRGGFWNFLWQLSCRANGVSGEIDLDHEDLARLHRYATGYGNGGFRSAIYSIFGRSLGESLGWKQSKYEKYML